MSSHRPGEELCPANHPIPDVPLPGCICHVLAMARADEREEIARAIDRIADEAVPYDHDFRFAARIARNG